MCELLCNHIRQTLQLFQCTNWNHFFGKLTALFSSTSHVLYFLTNEEAKSFTDSMLAKSNCIRSSEAGSPQAASFFSIETTAASPRSMLIKYPKTDNCSNQKQAKVVPISNLDNISRICLKKCNKQCTRHYARTSGAATVAHSGESPWWTPVAHTMILSVVHKDFTCDMQEPLYIPVSQDPLLMLFPILQQVFARWNLVQGGW